MFPMGGWWTGLLTNRQTPHWNTSTGRTGGTWPKAEGVDERKAGL
ncbi:hypothetical protein [Inoviridae sp.]|nr:hypothetical protein [Inoviridae sp.]UOF78998.1 hypothetical protein [Inoviridae sp.]UOF81652.1 hypothetical protein [Inoviridae sp.]